MTAPATHGASGRPRARGLGLPFPGTTGPLNAITDVTGVAVGETTIIRGDGPMTVGHGPIRTGVTAVLPRGHDDALAAVWSGVFALNGNGEMTGAHWIQESGQFNGPICLTNTHSVGIAYQAVVRWMARRFPQRFRFMLPVVAETCDWYLNDINGLHVLEEHALAAIDGAKSGPVAEGNVGGGTGMTTYEFKGGNGTSSRVVGIGGQNFTVGALVQANFGRRPDLTILGVPVGRIVAEHAFRSETRGSIIAVVGTDAPLLPSQLTRLAKRISLGVGRTGTPSNNGSGDIFLAFSTANRPSAAESGLRDSADHIPHDQLDPLFLATVEATEEAVVNAMVAAETMVGRDGHTVHALDHGRLLDAMRRFNRAIGA